jgi:hypothetical protein
MRDGRFQIRAVADGNLLIDSSLQLIISLVRL